MQKTATSINGCFKLQLQSSHDVRGSFTKIFQSSAFQKLELYDQCNEEFYSVSNKFVLRGLHFQIPPFDHSKIVYCLSGSVQDVVCDLRVGSATYGQAEIFDLSARQATGLYIPKGLAHGFIALEDNTILLYRTSVEYQPSHDQGILWNSVGVEWVSSHPVISLRDQSFPALKDFYSPFKYEL